VSESGREGILDKNEERLLHGALSFEERDARSVLLPLADVEAVPVDVTPAEVEDVAGRTGYSRFPVRENSELIGYLHLKDALEIKDRHRTRPIARDWVRDLAVVNAGDPLRTVLATMQRSNAHLARVDDADGTVLGVAALEDVLEHLVGEIRDDTQRALAAR
jgi:CBS domain containing-hemolysin-like protein